MIIDCATGVFTDGQLAGGRRSHRRSDALPTAVTAAVEDQTHRSSSTENRPPTVRIPSWWHPRSRWRLGRLNHLHAHTVWRERSHVNRGTRRVHPSGHATTGSGRSPRLARVRVMVSLGRNRAARKRLGHAARIPVAIVSAVDPAAQRRGTHPRTSPVRCQPAPIVTPPCIRHREHACCGVHGLGGRPPPARPRQLELGHRSLPRRDPLQRGARACVDQLHAGAPRRSVLQRARALSGRPLCSLGRMRYPCGPSLNAGGAGVSR